MWKDCHVFSAFNQGLLVLIFQKIREFYWNYYLPLCEQYKNFSWRCAQTLNRIFSGCFYILSVFVFYQPHFTPSLTDGKWIKFTCSTICIGSNGFYRGRDIKRSGFLKPFNKAQAQKQLNKTHTDLTTFFSARNQTHKRLCDASHKGADKNYNQQCNNVSSTFYMGLDTVY